MPYQLARSQSHPSESATLHAAAVARAMTDEDPSLVLQLLRDDGPVNLALPESGWTPLAFMAVCGLYDEALELIGMGADANKAEADGWTPLMFAANNGHASVVSLLLESGANVNARNRAGSSALTLARDGGYEDIVTLLLDGGALEHPDPEPEPEPEAEEGSRGQEGEQAEAGEVLPSAQGDTPQGQEASPQANDSEQAATVKETPEPEKKEAWTWTPDPNPPQELKIANAAVQEDFNKHKKRKGLFFW